MLHHRTLDPARRAFHVAEGEANRHLSATGDISGYFEIAEVVYREALEELHTALPPRKAKRSRGRLSFYLIKTQFDFRMSRSIVRKEVDLGNGN